MVQKSYKKAQNWDITEKDLSKTLVERSKGKKDRLLSGTKKELLDLYKKNSLPEELSPYVGEKIHKDGNKLVLIIAPYFQVDDFCLTIKERDLIDNVEKYYNKGCVKFQKLFEQKNALVSDAKDQINSLFGKAKEILEKDIANKESLDFNIDFEHTIFHWFLPRPLKMAPDEFFLSKEFIKPKDMSIDLFKKQLAVASSYTNQIKKLIRDSVQDSDHIFTNNEIWNIADKITEEIIKEATKMNETGSRFSFKDFEKAEKLSLEKSLIQDLITGYKMLKEVINITLPDVILFVGNKTRFLVNAASFNYQTYEKFLKTYRYKKDRFKKFEEYLEKNKRYADIDDALMSGNISEEQRLKILGIIFEMSSDSLKREKQQSPFRALLKDYSIQESTILHDSEQEPFENMRETILEKFAKLLYAENRIQGLNDALKSVKRSESIWEFINKKMAEVAFPAINIIQQTRSKISLKNQASKDFVSAVDDLVEFLINLPDYTGQMGLQIYKAKKALERIFELGNDKEIRKRANQKNRNE